MRESSRADKVFENDDDSGLPDVASNHARQLDLFQLDDIARPDYNIGKYATLLFASPHLKNLDDHRTFELPMLKDGDDEIRASISIHPLKDQIVPTTTTFKVFMAVIQLWRMQGGNPSGTVYFSDRQLAKVAGWSFSGVTAKRIATHVSIMQGTTIDWILSYKKKGKNHSSVQKMSLINDALHVGRKSTLRRDRFSANHTVTLHQMLVQNMLNNVVRPINFAALRQIKSDASTRLYMMLDMYLASKPKVERKSIGLLKFDLGYEGKRYDNRGERKRTLERLIRDLDGKELTSGKLMLTMEETADKKDWKLVARKISRIKPNRNFVKAVRDTESAEYLANDLTSMFEGGEPKRGYLVYLCQRYPENVLRDALSRAKSDYRGNVRTSVGAIFRYELEQTVKGRGDLTWHKPEVEKPQKQVTNNNILRQGRP